MGTTEKLNAPITGMSCAACAQAVEKALRGVSPGVVAVSVNLAEELASVEYDPELATPEALANAVGAAGFGMILPAEGRTVEQAGQAARELAMRSRASEFWVGVAFAVPLFLLSMGRDFGLLGAWASADWVGWLFFALATPVQFYTGRAFYTGAWSGLRNRRANMDTLVALGSSVAYFYSVAVLLAAPHHAHVYFETSAMIVTLIRLGKLLESRAKGRASQALRELLALAPDSAWIEIGQEELQEIHASQVQVGDVLVVKSGERVPVDGLVIGGHSAVDESILTGEAIPVDKAPGDLVYGGTLNRHGRLRIRASALGAESALGRIVALVRQAQAAKAPVQRLADQVAAVFVPAIVAIALAVFALWWAIGGEFVPAMIRMVAVLVIACPCALGLATPTAISAGMALGARQGALFRDPAALETLCRVRLAMFDKTGAITRGMPTLAEWTPLFGGADGEEALALAASAEAASEHPIAQAVVDGARSRGAALRPIQQYESKAGFGVEARIAGKQVRVGKPEFAFESMSLGDDARRSIERIEAQGQALAAVSIDGRPAGLLALADEVKPGAAEAIAALKRLGLAVEMLTGDHERAARAVARQVGIERVRAGLAPGGKEEAVREARQGGAVVAMIGDGVNDAPALACADVGIAIGAGAGAAVEAAGVTLVSEDLNAVARTIRLSRATMRIVKQNLFWAFFYNVALIPVAAGVLHGFDSLPAAIRDLHPVLAAAAMAFSSVTVVLNSLRLSRANLQ